jgi:hypothetical protein
MSNDPTAPIDVLGDLHGGRARSRPNPPHPRHGPERRAPISAPIRQPDTTSLHVTGLRLAELQESDQSQVIRQLRPLRSATIRANGTEQTIPPAVPTDKQAILDALRRPRLRH